MLTQGEEDKCGVPHQGHGGKALRQDLCSREQKPGHLISPSVIVAKTPWVITSKLPDPKLGKNAHPVVTLEQSPKATLLAGIFFVLRL